LSNWKYDLYHSIWGGLDFVFPPVCGGCDRKGSTWCVDCKNKVVELNHHICEICGLPVENAQVCKQCVAERPHFYALRAWAIFDTSVRNALHKLKYRRNMSLGDALAVPMIAYTKKLQWDLDIVVPIPLGRKRRLQRGYNQVAMIALPLALGLGLSYRPRALERLKETRSQVGLSRNDRRENMQNAFTASELVRGKNILVVDDVSTTGSTLSSAAEALISKGAKRVYGLSVARALSHHMGHA
jgi:ComF family protein